MRVLMMIVLLMAFWSGPAFALHPDEILADPVLEQRARALTHDVRCLVCQGEAIDESQAPLAADLRRLVRARVMAGDSDEEIRAFLTHRYGDYILMQPPVRSHTLLLWFGPLLVFAGAGVALWRVKRRHGQMSEAGD